MQHSRLKRTRALSAFIVMLLLWGCASTPEPADLEVVDDTWTLRRDTLLQLQNWELDGRIGITVEHQAWQASLVWVQRGENFLLDVAGPLGQGRLMVSGGPNGVRAERHDGRVVNATDVESLLRSELGWTLPVEGLRYWVKGVPNPRESTQSIALDELGRLAELNQGGWRIRYPSYIESDDVDLPHKIRLDSGDVSVRMVVDQWAHGV
jgi:outer membrane lipoprotein LolB